MFRDISGLIRRNVLKKNTQNDTLNPGGGTGKGAITM